MAHPFYPKVQAGFPELRDQKLLLLAWRYKLSSLSSPLRSSGELGIRSMAKVFGLGFGSSWCQQAVLEALNHSCKAWEGGEAVAASGKGRKPLPGLHLFGLAGDPAVQTLTGKRKRSCLLLCD